MLKMFLSTTLLLGVVFVIWVLVHKKRNKDGTSETYVCDSCGDTDCVCRKEIR
jgi:hypothetical protein